MTMSRTLDQSRRHFLGRGAIVLAGAVASGWTRSGGLAADVITQTNVAMLQPLNLVAPARPLVAAEVRRSTRRFRRTGGA
jgi:hypothetical protein